jgi:type II secretory pathway pseudopilin PulG
MLVVIIIIAILAGFLLPAVNFARTRATNAAIAMDLMSGVAAGVDAYKKAHDDFPPDGSNQAIVRRHILKRWPHIDASELAGALTVMFTTHRLDHAEAIPFWLGGFSSDAKHPFTGPGGPFVIDSSGTVYANPERVVGLLEFDKARLTLLDPVVLSAGPPIIAGQLSADGDNDPFPVYLPPKRKQPYVYFDARTYGGPTKPPLPATFCYYPAVANSPIGYAKPYLSSRPDPTSPYGFEWVNETSYQIIAAGLDDNYGGAPFMSNPRLFPRFPTGENYAVPGDDDNITNFSSGGKLEDAKP